MSGIINQSFAFNLKVLKILHLYPDKKPTFTYIWTSRILCILFNVPIPLLGVVYFLLTEEMEIVRAVDNAVSIIELICAVIKLSLFIKDVGRLKKCIHYFENPFFQVIRKQQKDIVEECIITCKRNTFIFMCVMGGGFVFWIGKPLISKNYILPVDMWLPFEVVHGTKSYYVLLLSISMGALYCVLGDGIIDPLIGGLACHVAGQLKILKNNLQHLNKYAEEKVLTNKTNEMKSKLIYYEIKRCVQHHNAIIDFTKEYEDCFSFAIFCQLLGSVLLIGFLSFQLSQEQQINFNSISLLVYIAIILIQIYFYCYYGTIIFEESTKVSEAIYMGEWYTFDTKSKQALFVIMERSKQPIIITAVKILEVSLETFTTILRRAYSLLAVLKNFL